MDDGSEDDLPVKRRRGKRHEQVKDAPPLAPCVPSVPSVDEDVDDASPVKRVRGKRRLQAAAEATVPTDPVVAKRRGRLRQQATQDGAEEELPKSMLRNGFSSSRPAAMEEEEEEEDDEAAEEFYQSMLKDEMPSSHPVRTTAFECSELPLQKTRTQRARQRLPVEEEEEEEEEEDDDEEFYQSMLRDEMPSSRPVRLTRSNRARRATVRFEEEEEDDDDAAEELAQSMLRNTSSTSNPQRPTLERRVVRRKEVLSLLFGPPKVVVDNDPMVDVCGSFCGRWALSSCNDEELQRNLGGDAKTEPLVLIIASADAEKFRIIHQRPWQDGLQVDCHIHLDDQLRPVPKALSLGDKDTWRHRWEDGLLTEHRFILQKELVMRSKLILLNQNELKEEIRLYRGPEQESLATATRIFQRKPFKASWKAAAAQFFSGTDVEKNLQTCIHWMRKAKEEGADLVVMPENSNRDRTYFKDGKPSRQLCWELSETLEGPFVSGVRQACRDLGLWVSLGVDLRGRTEPTVHIGILLIRPDGAIEGVVKKHVLWDYEYTLFEPGCEPYQVFDTELCCADGIVPEAARVLSLMGAQVLLNSLNSRGPDEMRVHIPLRAIENGVWHVASNTVGNPNTVGLLWPWTGGSEVCDPSGQRVVASEEHDDIVVGEVRPWESELKTSSWSQDIWASRRPELYTLMTKPLEVVPAAAMYGPVPSKLPSPGPEQLKVAMMQLSATHTKQCTEWMMQRQVSYAARRGAVLGVMPSLWCFRRGEVAADVRAAAKYSGEVLEKLKAWAKDAAICLCCSLVEEEKEAFFHTAYLVGSAGSVLGKYRKTHLGRGEAWASAGDHLCEVIEEPVPWNDDNMSMMQMKPVATDGIIKDNYPVFVFHYMAA
eukprot:symbB.v1.2.013703.t1/scaffold974.1/size359025/10